MPWGKVWVLLLLLELFGSISSQRMDKIQTCPGVEKNLLGKVPAAGKPKTPWESPRLSPARGGGEEASEEKMKLCRGGNPPAHPKGRAQGLALGWGHSDTAWGISKGISWAPAGRTRREGTTTLFVCLFVFCYNYMCSTAKHQLSLLQRNSEVFYWVPFESISLLAGVFPLKATAF